MASTQPGLNELTGSSTIPSDDIRSMHHTNETEGPGSLKRKTRQTRKRGGRDKDTHPDLDDGVGDTSRPRKRRKQVITESSTRTGQYDERQSNIAKEYKGVRGKRGLLEKVKDLPLELLLIEICQYLEPLDILRLARTSKNLRGILMSRSSKDIWETARANVDGLPPLPPDLNEPQYAHLLFDSYCHKCMQNRCEIIIWQCRMRCCKKCLSTTFYPFPYLVRKFPELARRESFGQLFDIICWSIPHLDCDFENIKSPWRHHDKAYLPDLVDVFFRELEEHIPDDEANIPAFQDWVVDKLNQRTAVVAHAEACISWYQCRTVQRLEEIYTIKMRRKEAIIEKLKALGWEETISRLAKKWRDPFSRHKSVNQPRDLTERSWNNIQGGLVEFLTEQKILLDSERRPEILRKRTLRISEACKDQREGTDPVVPFPSLGDAFSWGVFDGIPLIPIEQTSIEAELLECFQKLEPLISDWRSQADQKAFEILRTGIPTAVVPDLALAKTVFKCTSCNGQFWYADVFAHRCTIAGPSDDQAFLQRYLDRGFVIKPYDQGYSKPWDPTCIQYCPETSSKVTALMRSCGLDPEQTTVDELHVLDPLMECLTCSESNLSSRVFMQWELAALHSCDDIVRLSDEEIEYFRTDIEHWKNEAINMPASQIKLPFRCKICHVVAGKRMLAVHLKEKHNVTQMTNEHWYWNPGKTTLRQRVYYGTILKIEQ
ncbi:hypothetical protein K435DRAFT_778562 [Dendrothele bispora CBS 962.96]|uniref:F-box domain-containing protein n=1 Tax=Dendrothele bispora (strain CBS 962.96) TaxID=1314807 RepID=A0A4S8M3R1_DENBC|nr:hypothetical protein K435DRAFT_778562 [Dendrothele bispora CBS 962.96]